MLKTLALFLISFLFFFNGDAVAQNSINGTIQSYTVNGSGDVTQFVVKTATDPAEVKTIEISEPNAALSRIVIDCKNAQSNVTVTYSGSGSTVSFVSMTVN